MKKPVSYSAYALLWMIFLFAGCTSQVDNVRSGNDVLETGEANSVGISDKRLERIDKVMHHYIESGWMPGSVCLIARHGKIVYHKSFGYRDMEAGEPMQVDDIFRIASMTKAITSIAVMMLYEEGHFLLDEALSKYIPEFKDPHILEEVNREDSTYTSYPAEGEVTIRQLLNHTSGIAYGEFNRDLNIIYDKAGVVDGGIDITDKTLAETVKILAKLPLHHEPGEKFLYGLNTDVLGYLIEVISGLPLDVFFEERIFKPLEMTDICFAIPEDKLDRFVPLYEHGRDYNLRISDKERYKYVLEPEISYLSGGGGLCATALDYAIFLQMLLNGGKYNGTQLLSPKTIELMTTNHIGDFWGDGAFGLGFGITTEKTKAEMLSSEGNYWWSGYYNTSFWIDPEEDLIAVFMTQVYPMQHWDIHQKFQILSYQSIVE